MSYRPGQVPSGQPRYRAGDRPLPPIRGGESRPGESPPAPAAPSVTPPAEPAPPTPPTGDEHDPARARALIEKLRPFETEAKRLARELADAQARLKAIDDATLSETEKQAAKIAALEKSLADAQTAHREALIRTAIEREAHAQGAVKADVVYRLVDRAAIELDAAGEVKGAEKAVKALLEAEPYLKATTETRPGVPATPRANGNTTPAQKADEAYERMKNSGNYARL